MQGYALTAPRRKPASPTLYVKQKERREKREDAGQCREASCVFSLSLLPGILEVLHCVLVESPEALNIIKEGHVRSIISLLDKHGRNHKVRGAALPR